MDGNTIIKIFGVLLLSSFLPLTAYLFYSNYLPNKGATSRKLLEALKLQQSAAHELITIVDDNYSARDYIFPVAFATLLCVLWSVTMLFGADMELASKPHLLLAGSQALFIDGNTNLPPELIDYQQISLLVMILSMLGAYIWALQNVLVRFTIVDLPPSTYFSVAIRMLLATFVALMVRFLWVEGSTQNTEASTAQAIVADGSLNMLLVFAFFSGMFPERAIQYLKEKVPLFSRNLDRSKSDDLPLSMIEGINMFHKVRLAEIGIDNAQNLAETNLVELLIRTPFRPKRVIDWIGQAKLYVYFKSDIEKLRSLGIRTIFDYKKIDPDNGQMAAIANESELSPTLLQNVLNQIKDDTMLDNLENAIQELKAF